MQKLTIDNNNLSPVQRINVITTLTDSRLLMMMSFVVSSRFNTSTILRQSIDVFSILFTRPNGIVDCFRSSFYFRYRSVWILEYHYPVSWRLHCWKITLTTSRGVRRRDTIRDARRNIIRLRRVARLMTILAFASGVNRITVFDPVIISHWCSPRESTCHTRTCPDANDTHQSPN